MNRILFVATACALLALPDQVLAQAVSGQIRGTVTDDTTAASADVKIGYTNIELMKASGSAEGGAQPGTGQIDAVQAAPFTLKAREATTTPTLKPLRATTTGDKPGLKLKTPGGGVDPDPPREPGMKLKTPDPRPRPTGPGVLKAPPILIYGFPLNGSDMERGEFIQTGQHADGSNGIQRHGLDIVTRTWRTGQEDGGNGSARWSSLDSKTSDQAWTQTQTNASMAIYGKGVYAMSDGTVVGCWRNAPENPRPLAPGECTTTDCTANGPAVPCNQRGWIHSKLCTGEIAGGGNHVWILQENGVYALYAHFQPGTVPSKICPNNATFFTAPYNGVAYPDIAPEVAVAEAKQVKVKKGDFLGRVGNSGSSTGPHLHVHMEKDGSPAEMRFERDIWSDYDGAVATSDVGWTRLDEEPVPGKPVLVWPGRNANVKFNRNDIEAVRYQGVVDHLVASSMMPGLVTCENDNGDIAYRVIDWFRDNGGKKWYTKHGLSHVAYTTEKAKAAQNGYQETSHYDCGGTHVVVFKK